MNFGTLSSAALHIELGTDDSTRLFTDARRKAAVNAGVREFADLTECFIRQTTVVCSNATGEYNLLSTVNVPGADYVRPAKQRPEFQFTNDTGVTTYIGGDNFERRDPDWLNQYAKDWRSSTGGTPQFWYERMDGGKRLFGLTPPPLIDSSESAKVVLPYVAEPPTLVSDTDVPFTIASTASGASTGVRTDLDPYHQGIVHFAAYQLEKLRNEVQASQSQLQLFLGYVQRYLQNTTPKGGQTVKLGRSYFGEVRQRGQGSASADGWMNGWGWE